MSFTTGDFADLALYERPARPTSTLKWTAVASVAVGSTALVALCTIGALTTAGLVSVSLGANHSLASYQPDSSVRSDRRTPFGTLASSAKFFAARSSQTYKAAPDVVGLRGTIQAPDGFQSAAIVPAPAEEAPAPRVAQSSQPVAPRSTAHAWLENPPLPPVRNAFAAIADQPAGATNVFAPRIVGAPSVTPPLPPVRDASVSPAERLAELEPFAPVEAPLPPHRLSSAEEAAPLPPLRPAARLAPIPAPAPPVAQRQTDERPAAPQGSTGAGAKAPVVAGDGRNIFQKFFDALQQPNEPSNGVFGGPLPNDYATLSADRRTAVYDISAHTVYLPNGQRLEAHSGLGTLIDDPGHVNAKNRGATPPHLYDLQLRGQLFHGVQALRLNPVGQGAMYGRVGLLAHTFMLGPRGDSNGCVSFKDYSKFLQAYTSGQIQRLAVVTRLGGGAGSTVAGARSNRRSARYEAASKDGPA
jgi:hypothetical protein